MLTPDFSQAVGKSSQKRKKAVF